MLSVRAGELLKETELNKGRGLKSSDGKIHHQSHHATTGKPKLEDMGITKSYISRWQLIDSLSQFPAGYY